MPKVIYLTGAPASGKSSTSKILAERLPSLRIWEYGAKLTEFVKIKSNKIKTQNDLRTHSARIVTPADISALDKILIKFIEENRRNNNIIIDSHPVTREDYGFRITPFSLKKFTKLSPDEIWVLYATPQETRRRIKADSGGRPLIGVEDARTHTFLQLSVAVTYGASIGCPVYLFDTNSSREKVISKLVERLS